MDTQNIASLKITAGPKQHPALDVVLSLLVQGITVVSQSLPRLALPEM